MPDVPCLKNKFSVETHTTKLKTIKQQCLSIHLDQQFYSYLYLTLYMYLPVDRGAVQQHRGAFYTVGEIFWPKSSTFCHCASFHLVQFRYFINGYAPRQKMCLIHNTKLVFFFVLWPINTNLHCFAWFIRKENLHSETICFGLVPMKPGIKTIFDKCNSFLINAVLFIQYFSWIGLNLYNNKNVEIIFRK